MQRLHAVLATLAVAILPAASAHALTCYTLFDRNDSVLYRGTFPPVDMSPDGDAQRDAMRAAGQYLLFVDTDLCLPVEYRFGDGGTRQLSVENIIGDLRPMTARAGVPSGSTAPPLPPPRPSGRGR